MKRSVVLAVVGVLFAGVLLAGLQGDRPAGDSPMVERPNVVVVSLTTLRADHMPCYGYERDTTPNICGFAERNVMFDAAFAQGIWTLPSYASILTGRYPAVHGATTAEQEALPDDAVTLPEVLSSTGYRTAAFLGQGYHAPQFGFDQGFDTYVEVNTTGNDDIDRSVSRALSWLDGGPEEPFFLFVQGYDVHAPFDPPEPYAGRYTDASYDGILRNRTLDYNSEDAVLHRIVQGRSGPVLTGDDGDVPLDDEDIRYILDRYDEGAAYADGQVGRLLETLRQRDRLEDTVVVFLSEHGETLADRRSPGRGLFGRQGPYEEVIRVPLVVRIPGVGADTVDGKVELIDLMPTLMDLASVPGSSRPQVQGESLLPVIRGEDDGRRYVFTEADPNPAVAVRSDRWKLVERPGGVDALHDLSSTEEETANVIGSNPQIAERLRSQLEVWRIANRQLR